MATIDLLNTLTTWRRDIGRGSVFYAVDSPGGTTPVQWTTGELVLKHLCDTEGEITVEVNATTNVLTAPELTGDIPHKAYHQGEAPIITVPALMAEPDLRAILSPVGSASGGYRMQRPVVEMTIVIFPEQLFIHPTTNAILTLDPNGGTWLLESQALTTEQTDLLGLSMWFWRCFARKPSTAFRHEEGGKAVQPVEIVTMHDVTKPDGESIYTLGDPFLVAIDIDP